MGNNSTEYKLEEIFNKILKSSTKGTMTVVECSEYMNVSKDKIRELINKQNTDFPYFKVGTKVLINIKELDAWMEKVSNEHRIL
ncbi:excisionase [Clostridium butyricum]|uniref:excisionase n=1 Tax=Clostridium butyricum TaxID=1492 RepID=UPI00210357D2|nr:excisionase [Clostridium butyricum]MCQ2014680.1 excisionase family DNA-binding protein [Clostridium butyricum]MCQ2026553.1 excisionase family DNA-binding protein [Clostridium butyricum]